MPCMETVVYDHKQYNLLFFALRYSHSISVFPVRQDSSYNIWLLLDFGKQSNTPWNVSTWYSMHKQISNLYHQKQICM